MFKIINIQKLKLNSTVYTSSNCVVCCFSVFFSNWSYHWGILYKFCMTNRFFKRLVLKNYFCKQKILELIYLCKTINIPNMYIYINDLIKNI